MNRASRPTVLLFELHKPKYSCFWETTGIIFYPFSTSHLYCPTTWRSNVTIDYGDVTMTIVVIVVLYVRIVFTTRCTIVQSAVLRSHAVCLSVCLSVGSSVTLVDHDHIGWKSWKLIAWTTGPTSLLLVTQRSSTYSEGNMEKFSFNNYVRLNWVNRQSGDLRWRCGCLFTFVGASRGHLRDSTAFLLIGKLLEMSMCSMIFLSLLVTHDYEWMT